MHWTYCDVTDEDLFQGDILDPTDALGSILREYHEYFCREQYTGFVVLTQSCDLVRHAGTCKAPHITIAAIRELAPLLPEILAPIAGAGVENVYVEESRYQAKDTLRRIINQNDQSRGLFYLHPVATGVAPSLKVLTTASVAMLRVSISLRRKHYDVLCDARRYRLDPEYANKLGWLTGNLFSRVATKDWEDQEQDPKASATQCERLLQSITAEGRQNWVPQSWLDAARNKEVDLTRINPNAMRSSIETHKPPTPREAAAEVVSDVAEKAIANVGLQQIQSDLQENDAFIQEMASHLASLVRDSLKEEEHEQLRIEFADTRHGKGMATYVVRVLLVDFNKQGLPAEDFSDFLTSREIPTQTIKTIENVLRPIVNDRQRATAIKNTAENKRLFSSEAIRIIAQIVGPWIPVLRSASTLANSIGNRVKNNGAFKDAFRFVPQETENAGE